MMTTRTSPRSRFSDLILLLGLCAFVPVGLSACGTTGSLEKEAKPADLEKLHVVGAKAAGSVVWTSSREDGIPHLFTMKTDGANLQQLTKGAHTEWFPRFSPDGTKILFSRSRAKGFVRQSEASTPGLWDLYTINADGSDPQKVAPNAAWGTWVNGEEILFLRGGKVIRAKLDGGDETEVVDTAAEGPFAGATVRQPQLSPDGKYLALTLAGGRRQVGVWKVKKKLWFEAGTGAQVTWTPDGAGLVWLTPSGKELVEISQRAIEKGVPAKDAARTSLLDLPGKRSREAFPRLSSDGKWVVFGAAITGLEYDLGDFELYLWEVGSAPELATRLTFNGANDSWPDIFTGAPSAKPADKEGTEKAEAPSAEKAEDEEAPASDDAAKPEKAKAEEADSPAETEKGADAAPAAEEEAAPFKAQGKGKKPSPKAKKKHR